MDGLPGSLILGTNSGIKALENKRNLSIPINDQQRCDGTPDRTAKKGAVQGLQPELL